MAEWLVEEGIGEERALLVENGRVLAARMQWPGSLAAGQVSEGVLVARARGSRRGRARFPGGEEALVERLPRDASEGATMRFAIVRAALGEARRRKLAQARPTDADICPAPSLAERLGGKVVHRFSQGLWEEVWAEAAEGLIGFPGGELHFSATPAMVLVDVDGTLNPRELALAAVEPLAGAIARFDLAGSLGVDFPTLQAKDDRKAVDNALGAALADWDHERTAMNGFGFVQLVARFEGPSLLHRLHHEPAASTARHLLRQAELLDGAGAIELSAHLDIMAHLRDDWLVELQRRTGRDVRKRVLPALDRSAALAQLVPR